MGYNLNKARERVSQMRGGGLFWKAKKGKNVVRVLPAIEGKCFQDGEDLFFWGQAKMHEIRSDAGYEGFPCLSPKWCPACAVIRVFEADGDDGLKEKAQHLKPRARFKVNLITSPKSEIMIWSCSGEKIEEMLEIIADDEWGDFTDPEDGFCININKTGDGRMTRYSIRPSTKTFDLPTGWEDDANDLTVGGRRLSAKDMRDVLVDKYDLSYDGLHQAIMADRKERVKK